METVVSDDIHERMRKARAMIRRLIERRGVGPLGDNTNRRSLILSYINKMSPPDKWNNIPVPLIEFCKH